MSHTPGPDVHDQPAQGQTGAGESASQLTVRQLLVDLKPGFGRHWHGGDPFRSALYNALSMSFPIGEQSFIDAVRDAAERLPTQARFDALRADIAQFIGQEATHRRVHALYNEELERQGLVNHWQNWAAKRMAYARSKNMHVLNWLAVTVAFEHCTAVLAHCTLAYRNWFEAAEPPLRTLWRWHAAEETEHRAVAFELYRAVGGNEYWRKRWFIFSLMVFSFDAMRQTVLNLWYDRSLFKPRTWWGAATFFFGRNGALWRVPGPLLAFLRSDFHPHRVAQAAQAKHLADAWLADHASAWRAVR